MKTKKKAKILLLAYLPIQQGLKLYGSDGVINMLDLLAYLPIQQGLKLLFVSYHALIPGYF